jgi:ribosomal protein S18 acetylase RimI-like enzyme
MEITLRNAREEDFPEVFPLLQQLWPDQDLKREKSEKIYKNGLNVDRNYYLCALHNKKISGFCSYSLLNNFWQEACVAYIYVLVVDQNQRGNGIGRELIERVLEESRTRNAVKAELHSDFDRKEAHGFYEKQGFTKRAYLFIKDL